MSDNLPRMDYRQYRRARRLVHECCNYDGGNCLLLDDGEPCVCVQSISFSLMCRWFRVAVLPLDGELAAALCAGEAGNGVPSAGRPLSPNPTGGNTAPTAPGADGAPFPAPPVQEGCGQFLVKGQNSHTEPAAHEGKGNALDAHARLPVV